MFYILNVMGECGDPGLANIFMITRKAFTIIQIVAPVIAIISLAIHLSKNVVNPENKKGLGLIKNWLIGLVMVYVVPILVNVVMSLLGESYNVSACWGAAGFINIKSFLGL